MIVDGGWWVVEEVICYGVKGRGYLLWVKCYWGRGRGLKRQGAENAEEDVISDFERG